MTLAARVLLAALEESTCEQSRTSSPDRGTSPVMSASIPHCLTALTSLPPALVQQCHEEYRLSKRDVKPLSA